MRFLVGHGFLEPSMPKPPAVIGPSRVIGPSYITGPPLSPDLSDHLS